MNKQFLFRGFRFEADKGAGNGDPTPAANDANPATPPAGAQNSDTSGENKMVSIERFNEVNNKLKKLEEDAAKAAKAQQEADEKRLEEQQQWRELAEERGKQLEGVKGKATDYDKLAELVAKQLKTEIDAWPEKVKNLFPANEMPVLEMLEWAERFRPLALEMSEDKPATPGNHRGPRMSGAAGSAATQEQQKAWGQRAAQRYR